MDDFLLGAAYYPEWWPEEQWETDFEKMADLGLNLMRVGEFAWSFFEPREGEYHFEAMARAIDLAAGYGIKTILGTPTAVCPPWLYRKFPEVKGGNENGDYDFGGRKGQCLSSKIFLQYAEKITRAEADYFCGNKNVVGWQLDNEPGFPFNDFDDRCEKGFQSWLQKKYGTVSALNKAWFTAMWSNVYNDFDEIRLPVNAAEGGWTPGLQLDYRKYFSFVFNRLLKTEAEIIRSHGNDQFIYTNWPGANWSVDCFEAESYLDFAAWDNYVTQPAGQSYRVQLRASMEHSFCRRLSNGSQKFLVAEQRCVSGADNNPDVIRAQTWLNVSHGAFATCFFEWRMPIGGTEAGYESILDPDGNFNECEAVFRRLASELREQYPKFADTKTVSPIGAIYSHENSWAMPGWRVDGFYDEEFFNAYGGFKNKLANNVDVLSVSDDFSSYRVLIAPNLKILSPEDAERLNDYVKNGGILVISAECGTKDHSNLLLEKAGPGLLTEAAGVFIRARTTADRLFESSGEKPAAVFDSGAHIEMKNQIFRLSLQGAKTAAHYTAGRLKSEAAVTVNSFGKGFCVCYGSDGNDLSFYEALADLVRTRFTIQPIAKCGDGILISTRKNDEKEFVFAINMKDAPAMLALSSPCADLLNGGRIINGSVTLKNFDVLFAEVKK